ncbi:HEPN domain-containing protein [Micromonospora sp. CPCC 205546]|uniref:HEPN domain-containing protein n=1 Tax=Micromonospora sp. CPCC 205546 TaxID=3122397 RepID=UPI002FEE8F04
MGALEDLRHSLTAVRALAEMEGRYSDPPEVNDRAACFGLRGACTVLTVACFESFLRTLFEEQLDRLRHERIPLMHYGDKLRTVAIYASLELAMKGDHRTRGSEKAHRIPEVLSAAKAIVSDSFLPRALSSTGNNPDPDCVKRMFNSVGCNDIFNKISQPFSASWPKPVSLDYCKEKLESLVLSRHQVAHTADAAHVLRSELTENALFVETLAVALSAQLESHVDALISAARVAHSLEEQADT